MSDYLVVAILGGLAIGMVINHLILSIIEWRERRGLAQASKGAYHNVEQSGLGGWRL